MFTTRSQARAMLLTPDDGADPTTAAYAPPPAGTASVPPWVRVPAPTHGREANSAVRIPGTVARLAIPDPAIGGEMGQTGVLGWSEGYGRLSVATPFTGQVLTGQTADVRQTGPVGLSTRSTNLAAQVRSLWGDATPDEQVVAADYLTALG